MMIKKIVLFTFILSIFSSNSFAFDRISVGLGSAEESTDVYRIGLQKDFSRSWYKSDSSELTGYWEVSLGFWDTDDNEGDDITVFAISPVFTYRFKGTSADPYIEAGAGVSYLSNHEIGDLDLGSNFQFENRLGFGVRFGAKRQHDLNVRYMHYSNASIKSPNDGINMFLVSYSFAF